MLQDKSLAESDALQASSLGAALPGSFPKLGFRVLGCGGLGFRVLGLGFWRVPLVVIVGPRTHLRSIFSLGVRGLQ